MKCFLLSEHQLHLLCICSTFFVRRVSSAPSVYMKYFFLSDHQRTVCNVLPFTGCLDPSTSVLDLKRFEHFVVVPHDLRQRQLEQQIRMADVTCLVEVADVCTQCIYSSFFLPSISCIFYVYVVLFLFAEYHRHRRCI